MRKGLWGVVLGSLLVLGACSTSSGTQDAAGNPDANPADEASDTGFDGALDVVPGDAVDLAQDVPDPEDTLDAPNPDLADSVQPDTVDGGDVTDTTADTADTADVSDAGDTTDTVEPPLAYFDSAELGIKIVGPSATGAAQSLGSMIQIAGLVAGNPDSIEWATGEGQTGYAQGTPFFLSTPIVLKNGDNTITLTAKKGEEVATDRLTVTYNPGFLFGSDLQLRPGVVFVGATSSVIFRVDMSLYPNFEPSTLKLCESTPEGTCINDIHAMVDNGQVGSSGDEVAEDGIYSWKKSYTPTAAGPICFRVKAVVKAGYQQYTAYSPVECLEVVARITQQTCTDTKALLNDAKAAYEALPGDPTAGRQAALDLLAASPLVAESGEAQDGNGIWVLFTTGYLGAINFNAAGNRGGTLPATATPPVVDYAALDPNLRSFEAAAIDAETWQTPILAAQAEIRTASKRTMELAPFNSEFGSKDEAIDIHGTLNGSVCPTYSVEGPFKGATATLARFRTMADYGILSITSHGESLFGTLSPAARSPYAWTGQKSQEIIWTGEEVDCGNFVQTSPTCSGPSGCPAGSECIITEAQATSTTLSGVCVDFKQVDLLLGRVAMGPSNFAILPSFVKKYRRDGYPNSLVYLGTCRSMWNGTMAMEFYGAGARAVLGYTGYVSSDFAFEQGSAVVRAMVEQTELSGAAMPPLSLEDPANPGTKMRFLGASNLNVFNSDLINMSFETGDLTGWQKTGDGRVISKLGISIPVEGKFMALISTGLGFTPQVGEIYQTFCVPEDKMSMSFYWKYFSEEFKEFCGSSYQDTFEATLEGDEGQVTFVNVMVDDLCPVGECDGCGSQYDGLSNAEVSFDRGDVWMTQWRKAEKNIMALAGKGSATLRFFSTDKGDSIYDTVILIDAINFQ